MAASPGVTTIINVYSPRRFDPEMANGLMTMAEHGQPVSVTPFTLMGAMAPVMLAAALVQQNAEALFARHAVGRARVRRTGAGQGQRGIGAAGPPLPAPLPGI